jgi:hypothetical protein
LVTCHSWSNFYGTGKFHSFTFRVKIYVHKLQFSTLVEPKACLFESYYTWAKIFFLSRTTSWPITLFKYGRQTVNSWWQPNYYNISRCYTVTRFYDCIPTRQSVFSLNCTFAPIIVTQLKFFFGAACCP